MVCRLPVTVFDSRWPQHQSGHILRDLKFSQLWSLKSRSSLYCATTQKTWAWKNSF